MNRKKIFQFIWRVVKISLITFFASSILFTLIYRFVPPPYTPLMLIRTAGQFFKGQQVHLERNWVSIESISPNMWQAAVAAEDNKFTEHFGFDFEAIQKARKYNAKHTTKMRGASTISQQTAKNVFLWPQRSWLRKGLEVYFTLLIELMWDKQRILEVYLNVIETGDGVYGVGAAARKYFHKEAANLGRRESALIAAVLPSPRKWNPAHPTGYLSRRQGRILNLMSKIGPVEF
ncbi:MAG: monofunctional biosynthetic peptidoglycan transglycosylase [Bacteroidetes bacterium]|nr:monofunctional biosynthetic peptidoglycan transglycosylase [Bacteroidota bacterium]